MLADLAFEMGEFTDAQNYVSQQRDVMIEEDTSVSLYKLTMISFFAEKFTSAKSFAEKLAPAMIDGTGNFKDEVMATNLGAILGISYLRVGNIRQALAIFLKLSPKRLERINDVSIPMTAIMTI